MKNPSLPVGVLMGTPIIGKVIGTRTWGGEIWLSSNNFLVDRGIATAAETGVYGPEGVRIVGGNAVWCKTHFRRTAVQRTSDFSQSTSRTEPRRYFRRLHGVDPDIVVDNLPHATFKGEDAQLKAAVEYLQKQIKDKPVEQPAPPRYPDKAGR